MYVASALRGFVQQHDVARANPTPMIDALAMARMAGNRGPRHSRGMLRHFVY